ncbi:hypothetical protein IV203_023463 [Nitzschia inconspicua]|uniref:Uncharacterized protein n=1 Tax=Nitzschia inconspicua TaxID=303405 RepID=A0A9K3KDP4_9STRA|nr:hypothetical protein IV203_023463 [Nitzschia inconspicua]
MRFRGANLDQQTYDAVGESHVEDQCNKRHDPLLKLYYGRPLYINHNEDVAGCVANGAICEFGGVKPKPAVSQKDFETIIIVTKFYFKAILTSSCGSASRSSSPAWPPTREGGAILQTAFHPLSTLLPTTQDWKGKKPHQR